MEKVVCRHSHPSSRAAVGWRRVTQRARNRPDWSLSSQRVGHRGSEGAAATGGPPLSRTSSGKGRSGCVSGKCAGKRAESHEDVAGVRISCLDTCSSLTSAAASAAHASIMLDIKTSADYLSRTAGTFTNFSMLFAGNYRLRFLPMTTHRINENYKL